MKMKTVRSTKTFDAQRIEKIEKKLTKLTKDIEKLKADKTTLEWQLGRYYQGKRVHAECKVASPLVMCSTCDCWKKTREMCS